MVNSEFGRSVFLLMSPTSGVRRLAVTRLDRLRWISLFVCLNRRGRLRRNLTRMDVLGVM